MTITDRAQTFKALHSGPDVLLLANCWDAGSARIIEAQGARALATTSAGVAWAHGVRDGDSLSAEVLLATVREIASATCLPLTVDIEGGFGEDAAQVGAFAARLIEAGAVGVNIEDGDREPHLLAERIRAIRAAAETMAVPLFINARTDVYLRSLKTGRSAPDEVVTRAALYSAAGCDGLFPAGLSAPDAIAAIVRGTASLPLNLLALPSLPPLEELQRLGVRRLSAGSAIAEHVLGETRRLAADFLKTGDSGALFAGAPISYGEMNGLLA